ncbi:hypothetical protein Q3G72_028323 [Acer saccharum]|nr:hypothetical protein Q3G72_028323 [Acer saccharum]
MICDGLDIGYFSNIWIYHGELDFTQARLNNEQLVQVDDMHGMLRNAFGVLDDGGSEFDGVDLSGGEDDNYGGGDENIDCERARARRADWAPGPGVMVLFPQWHEA